MSTAQATESHYDTLSHPAWRGLFAKYYVKVIESWTGRDGYGMNAELYRKSDDRKIADVRDDGNGGCYMITRFHKLGGPTTAETEEYNEFLAEVGKLPPMTSEWDREKPLDVSEEIALATLAELDEYRALVKEARGKSRYLFFTREHEAGQVGQWDLPKGTDLERAKAFIQKDRPDAIIINEVL